MTETGMAMLVRSAIGLCVLLSSCAHPPGPGADRGRLWERAERFGGTSSNGPYTAYLGRGIVVPPNEDVPPALRAFAGHWQGWAGRNRAGSAAVEIDRVSATSASGSYAYAAIENVNGNSSATRIYPLECTVNAGDELDCNLSRSGPAALKVYLKLRADGDLMFLYTGNYGQSYGMGLLARQDAQRS